MHLCRETVKMAVPPGNRRGSNPRRTRIVRRRFRGPRTPGRTGISTVRRRRIHELSGLEVLSLFPDLPTRALGSLQGVELHHFLGSRLDVGGEIAGAVFPLDLGVGAGLAIGVL